MTLITANSFGHLLYRTLQVVEGRLRALKKKEKQERIKCSPRDRKKKHQFCRENLRWLLYGKVNSFIYQLFIERNIILIIFCYLELVVALKRERSHSLHSVRFDFFYELILICLGKERAIFIWISSFI